MQRVVEKQSETANASLDRLHRDGEAIAGHAMAEAPINSDDAAERWGRRIGRSLGWFAAAFLLYQLYLAYGA